MTLTTPDHQPLGVEVLEQRLGEPARGPELVAQLGEGDRTPVPLGGRDDPFSGAGQDLDVKVKRPRHADGAPGRAQGQDQALSPGRNGVFPG